MGRYGSMSQAEADASIDLFAREVLPGCSRSRSRSQSRTRSSPPAPVSEGRSSFAGKVAVVTGGASGMGERIVRRLVAEGASVVAADLNADRLKSLAGELGDAVDTLEVDVRREADVAAMVERAVDQFGRLDLGFNVAGTSDGGPLATLDEVQWDLTVDVCLKGVYLSMKQEGRRMLEQDGVGAIVNIASLNSIMPMRGGAAYYAAKAGCRNAHPGRRGGVGPRGFASMPSRRVSSRHR